MQGLSPPRVSPPPCPAGCPQVRVDLQAGGMQVCVREGDEERTLMEGDFTHKINTETSLWSLEPGSCVVVSAHTHTHPLHTHTHTPPHRPSGLQLSLSKTSEVWWNAVLKGEEEIDINQINRERSMATVDEEEHAVLDRLSFDYHQKLQGKPQSHETVSPHPLREPVSAES